MLSHRVSFFIPVLSFEESRFRRPTIILTCAIRQSFGRSIDLDQARRANALERRLTDNADRRRTRLKRTISARTVSPLRTR